jgi:NADH peroxidase
MSKTKIVIVGASHGGHQAAIDLLDRYSDLDVTIYEESDFVSFMSCGMKLFLEGKTTGQDDVRNFSPDQLEKLGGKVVNNSKVIDLDPANKEITVKNVKSGQSQKVSYDKLILTVGVNAVSLDVPGKELDNLLLMRGYDWASKINAAINDDNIKNVTVIGAGNGISAVEALNLAGKHVTLIDTTKKPLQNFFNPNIISVFENELKNHDVDVKMDTLVQGFAGKDGKVTTVKTNKGDIPTDLVIETVGIVPNTDWLKGIVDLDDHGHIQTDDYFRTNVKDVYAVGDAVLPYSIPANTRMPIPSAVAARHEAKYVVDHIFEDKPAVPFKGLVGGQVLELFNEHGVAVGLNARTAGFAKIQAESSDFEDRLRPAYIPEQDNPKVKISLTFNKFSHQLLGANVVSSHDVTGIANVFSLAIGQKLSLEDLAEQDFFFSPSFDKQWNLVNLAARHALGYRDFK